MTIVEFLLARIAEVEALARAADASRWRLEDKGITFDMYGDRYDDGEAMARLEARTHANADLIVEFSPPRVRAECEAKRRIIEVHQFDHIDGAHLCQDSMVDDEECEVLRALAGIYVDHPDFDARWLA